MSKNVNRHLTLSVDIDIFPTFQSTKFGAAFHHEEQSPKDETITTDTLLPDVFDDAFGKGCLTRLVL